MIFSFNLKLKIINYKFAQTQDLQIFNKFNMSLILKNLSTTLRTQFNYLT